MNRTIYKIIESIFTVSIFIFGSAGFFSFGFAWLMGIFYLVGIFFGHSSDMEVYYIGMVVFYSGLSALVTYPIVTRYEEQYK